MSFRATRPVLSAFRNAAARPAAARRAGSSLPLFAGIAIAGSVVGYGLMQNKDVFSYFKEQITLHADSAAQDFRDDPKSKAAFRVDPDTNIQFPLDLSPSLATTSPALSLVGLGVRKVSFLRVKVYSAGFYLDEVALKDLHNVEGWHTFTAQHLLTPPTKTPSDPLDAPQLSGEGLMKNLFDRPVAVAVRIVPNRNTDFGHLRDAFTRALQARQKLARSKGELTDDDEQRITQSIQTLKSFFPAQTVQKGKQVVLLRPREGGLIVEFEGTILGRLNDPWIGKQLMLTYFADREVVSEKLKEDVAKGLEGFIRK
ncbi:hypothetical protein I302_101022 [Kwoniella bestiolae CBS 10118]|uniref:Chalcone isomerase domain-containing protein n=1 Tax=Kwoniella bestiolae CBS 10118 TaxID=1296100 RepID=A0A1B9G6T8_9TREE|nr:hypothetical protein I302_04398 [Kwoniella bestiolae CBS 10118]OCF26711.1 hypothetical protein I302_04398 [Kwoniella bestiolae CBS 10118]